MTETRVCGKLERITEKVYEGGMLNYTLLEISAGERREEYDFYGEIPSEFVGKDVVYSLTENETAHGLRVNQSVSVGKLIRKPNDEYFLEPQNPIPAVPHTVRASKDWNYKKSQG